MVCQRHCNKPRVPGSSLIAQTLIYTNLCVNPFPSCPQLLTVSPEPPETKGHSSVASLQPYLCSELPPYYVASTEIGLSSEDAAFLMSPALVTMFSHTPLTTWAVSWNKVLLSPQCLFSMVLLPQILCSGHCEHTIRPCYPRSSPILSLDHPHHSLKKCTSSLSQCYSLNNVPVIFLANHISLNSAFSNLISSWSLLFRWPCLSPHLSQKSLCQADCENLISEAWSFTYIWFSASRLHHTTS